MPKKTAIADVPLGEIMWAAGFYEGEGSVGERHVLISQKQLWPLQKLERLFEGNIGSENRPDGCYQWALCGERGRDFVAAIYPYLSPKRQSQIDDKFITWQKFRIVRSEKRKAAFERFRQASLTKIERDPITGRMRRRA